MTVYNGQIAEGHIEDDGRNRVLAFGYSATGQSVFLQSVFLGAHYGRKAAMRAVAKHAKRLRIDLMLM
jgi:hypothetical protein